MGNNKRALLVVSYGSAHATAREKTIGRIEQELSDAFRDRRLYRAWTSDFMRRRREEADGIHVDDVREAIARMKADGVHDVLVQPVFIICASEYKKVLDAFAGEPKGIFDRVRIGTPLLSSEDDVKRLAEILPALAQSSVTAEPGEDRVWRSKALVFMGHGSSTEPEANDIYRKLEAEAHRQGSEQIVIGTIDGAPGYSHVTDRLKNLKPDGVILMPLLLTAGAHVLRDMQGDREGSWKSRIETEGYPVLAVAKGIAEFAAVRALFAEHARAAEASGEDADHAHGDE